MRVTTASISLRATACAVAFSALLTAASAPVGAAPVPRQLRDGIAAYTQVEYQQAVMYLKAALQRTRDRTHLAKAFFYLGCTYLALDRRAKAREAFETLLAFTPDYVPERGLTSPKIASFFSRVRRSYATPDGPPSMAHSPPRRVEGKMTAISLQVVNLSPRLRPMLRYRGASSSGYFSVEANVRAERTRFVIPTPTSRYLYYFFVLVDRGGVVVQQLGSARKPYRVPTAGANRSLSTPWYKTWWFWTIAGGVVAGTTAMAVGLAVGGGGGDAAVRVRLLRPDGKALFGD